MNKTAWIVASIAAVIVLGTIVVAHMKIKNTRLAAKKPLDVLDSDLNDEIALGGGGIEAGDDEIATTR